MDFDGNEDPLVRVQLGRALVTRATLEIANGHPRDALDTCERLEREFANADDDALVWRARCQGMRAFLALGELDDARTTFELAYQVFVPTPRAIREMVLLVSDALAGGGVAGQDLVDLLATDHVKADVLRPLIVALCQENGEDVRAAEEVLDVAADIRASWYNEGQGQ